MRIKPWMAGAALLMVAACSQPQAPTPTQKTPTQKKLGGVAATVEGPKAGAFETCVEAAEHFNARSGERVQAPLGYKLYRIIPPNGAVTLDFNPERLNVYTDDAGIIVKARCG